MLDSPAAPATTVDPVDEPIPQPPSAAPSVEVSSTEVPITTQDVDELFGRVGAPRFLLTRCGLSHSEEDRH
jgi:hypothetical protein